MGSLQWWMAVALLVVIVFFSTANAALRQLSRVRLAERLEKRGRVEWVARLSAWRDELIFSFAFMRLSAILALVLLIARACDLGPGPGHGAGQYLLVFLICIALAMLFGVAIPNTWARYGGDAFLAAVMPVIPALHALLYPLVATQRLFDALIRRLAGIPQATNGQDDVDQIEREILGAVSEGELAGAVHEDEAEMIESVMEFRDTEVSEIMTPRTEIVALPATATLAEARELITREGHSRIPIYAETIDNIQGVLYAKDLLALDGDTEFDPLKVMRKVPFVPEAKRISDLLQELREQKVHLAIVLDEYGGTSGLVTIEDILEELVGEISDEYEEPEPDPILRIDQNTLEVDARVHIDEINEELNVELPEDEDYDTIGGFVFSTMGKIPSAGEELCFNNVRLRVIDAEERKINRLRVEVIPEETSV